MAHNNIADPMARRQLSENTFRSLVRKMRRAQQVYFGISRSPDYKEARQTALLECRRIENQVDAELGISPQVSSGLFSPEGQS